jgi:hypothetical protein
VITKEEVERLKEEVERLKEAWEAARDLAKDAGEKWAEASKILTEQKAAEKRIVLGSIVATEWRREKRFVVARFAAGDKLFIRRCRQDGKPVHNSSFEYVSLSGVILRDEQPLPTLLPGTGK